ncbi:hypothetical protein GGI43DRAFT_411259 [Trichoderma evansii]
MSIRTIPTYHPAPNFSIPPPDANGPLRLGTLLVDLHDPTPLNPADRVPIQDKEIFRSRLVGFRTENRQRGNKELGIFARLLGLDGVGGILGVSGSRATDEILSVARLDTEFFIPSLEYIKLAVETPSVRSFCKATRDRLPLFLVTGIKVARGASASVVRTRTVGGGVKGSPGTTTGQVELGVNVRSEIHRENDMSFEDASDFVLAYRVARVRMKKDGVQAQVYIRGATMLADDAQEIVDRDSGELEVIYDFSTESMETDNVLLDETGTADSEICKWVLKHT